MHTFKTSDGTKIPTPEDFQHLSGFFKGYTDTYSIETSGAEKAGPAYSDDDASLIHLPSIEARHLRHIFSFLQQLRNKSPLAYACALQGVVDKVEDVPGWAKKFFGSLTSNELTDTANVACFLDVAVLIEHVLAYLVFKVETSSVDDMRKLLGSEGDFKGEREERLVKEKAWKPTMSSRPYKDVVGKPHDYSTAYTSY